MNQSAIRGREAACAQVEVPKVVLKVNVEPFAAGFPRTFATSRDEHDADPSSSGRTCYHNVLKPGVHKSIPKHIREPNELIILSSRDPAKTVSLRKILPIPLRLIKHTGRERLRMQCVDFGVRERTAPREHNSILVS